MGGGEVAAGFYIPLKTKLGLVEMEKIELGGPWARIRPFTKTMISSQISASSFGS